MYISENKTDKGQKGFTLVELIVSIGIFALVVTTALGSLLVILDTNRETRAMQLVMDNVQFAVDEMIRDIRTGSEYDFPSSNNDCNGINFDFVDSDGNSVTYRCSGAAIQKSISGGGFSAITAPEITITRLQFIEKTGGSQPLALITITGEVEADTGETRSFSLQTLVSQRFIDN